MSLPIKTSRIASLYLVLNTALQAMLFLLLGPFRLADLCDWIKSSHPGMIERLMNIHWSLQMRGWFRLNGYIFLFLTFSFSLEITQSRKATVLGPAPAVINLRTSQKEMLVNVIKLPGGSV